MIEPNGDIETRFPEVRRYGTTYYLLARVSAGHVLADGFKLIHNGCGLINGTHFIIIGDSILLTRSGLDIYLDGTVMPS